jgi:hypothetical protein
MYVGEALQKSFVLIQSNWPVKKARQFIEDLKPTHVVLKRGDPEVCYYLYTRDEVLDNLKDRPDDAIVWSAYQQAAAATTPAVDTYADYVTAPTRGVVVDDGRLTGFFDKRLPTASSGPPRSPRSTRGLESARTTTRSLIADFPEQVRLGETHPVKVSLSPGKTSGAPQSSLTPGSVVEVLIQPRRGFTLVGAGEGNLTIPDNEKTPSLEFSLEATELGPGKVQVIAFHKGQPLGLITLAASVTPASGPLLTARRCHEKPVEALSVNQPDLLLLIMEDKINGEPAIKFLLAAKDPAQNLSYTSYGPVILKMDPVQYIQDFFKDIEKRSIDTPEDRTTAIRHLAAKGASLFRTVIPNELQEVLWSLRDRIKYVQVLSQEPWIPWELCRLLGKENGRVVEGPFLCEQFAMTRWLLGCPRRLSLALSNVALVVPKDSGLPAASAEKKYMLSLAGNGRKIELIPATHAKVTKALADGNYDGWHFTGHGRFQDTDPNLSSILLENEDDLNPEDLSGEPENLGLKKPLIFLNACQVGQSGMSLTGIGGWASKFLSCGAAAFIGAYWSVYDKDAQIFAETFYDQLLTGTTIAESVQKARAKAGYLTGLAYTVFADPFAKIRSKSPDET